MLNDYWLAEAKIYPLGHWNLAQKDHSFLDIQQDDRLGFGRISVGDTTVSNFVAQSQE